MTYIKLKFLTFFVLAVAVAAPGFGAAQTPPSAQSPLAQGSAPDQSATQCERKKIEHRAEDTHVHQTDPAMLSEHMAALALAPHSEATHVAVANCAWSNPETWRDRRVPDAGARVLIPAGVTVDYDVDGAVSLFTVRVDGTLSFAKERNTRMILDTMLVAPEGKLSMGSVTAPINADVSAEIVFADNGPINIDWDPQLLSRGLVSHGAVEIHGGEKLPFSKLATAPRRGDKSITLETAPRGWRIGDNLVLTGTVLVPHRHRSTEDYVRLETEDEELTITEIDGTTISFSKPLRYHHLTPRDDLKPYVANLTRNIVFTTENVDALPVYQRGHTMFMHSDAVDVRFAEFRDLGRTNKKERAFDIHKPGNRTIAHDSNIKARYPFHFHRTGVTLANKPTMAVGNSVWRSPGWAYVHHESNANYFNNVGYDAFGAIFVAEVANETGRWVNNIAIKSFGVGGGAKAFAGRPEFDLARGGAGYWFQGRLVASRDNIAAGMPGGHGYVYMHRGPRSEMMRVRRENLFQPETMLYVEDGFANEPPINQHVNNLAFAVQTGNEVVKASAQQGSDLRSFISEFTAWEVQTGLHNQYTGHYTFKNIDLIAARLPLKSGGSFTGIEYGPNTLDMTVVNAKIAGFEKGIFTRRHIVNLGRPFDGVYDYIFANVTFSDVNQNWVGISDQDLIIDGPVASTAPFRFESANKGIVPGPGNHRAPNSARPVLGGIKTDALGRQRVSYIWDELRIDFRSLGRAMELEGYWKLPDGRTVTVLDNYVTDRVTHEMIKDVVYVEVPNTDFRPSKYYTRVTPQSNGTLDLDSRAPAPADDAATIAKNTPQILDLLSNDRDPDGDAIQIDGIDQPEHGLALPNAAGDIVYTPDYDFVGEDAFFYWVEDAHGKTARARVQLTVK